MLSQDSSCPSDEKYERMMIEAMAEVGISQATIFAFKRTGRIVTEMNKHLLTPEELREWNDAVDEYHRRVGVWRCDLKRGVEFSALLQKRPELIHREQELADVVVQRRLAQSVAGMGFAERDCGRLACGVEEHPRRTPSRLLRAVAEPVKNADETPPRKLVRQPGHSSTLDT